MSTTIAERPAERLEDIDRRLEALLESLLRIFDLIDRLPPLPPGKPGRPPIEKRHLELVSKRAA
jgi:hypothetical protein